MCWPEFFYPTKTFSAKDSFSRNSFIRTIIYIYPSVPSHSFDGFILQFQLLEQSHTPLPGYLRQARLKGWPLIIPTLIFHITFMSTCPCRWGTFPLQAQGTTTSPSFEQLSVWMSFPWQAIGILVSPNLCTNLWLSS
jgi:hypothetical protein